MKKKKLLNRQNNVSKMNANGYLIIVKTQKNGYKKFKISYQKNA